MIHVLMNSIHTSLFWNQIRIFKRLGIKVLMPRQDNVFGYGVNFTPGIHDHPHFLGTVIPFNWSDLVWSEFKNVIVWSGCFEQHVDAKKMAETLERPLLLYACTNKTPYAAEHGSYLLTEDLVTFTHSDVPVRRFVVFPPDYEAFSETTVPNRSGQITSLIGYYKQYWPEWHLVYEQIASERGDKFTFKNYDLSLDYPSVPCVLRNSKALLHLKSSEGSGNSMMEALASGCPVIVNEDLLTGRTCSLFLQPGFNCATIRHHMALEDFDEAMKKIPAMQASCARSIRSAIREEVALATVDWMLNRIISDAK